MNIRKGLFRLWLVCSVIFTAVVCVISYRGIRDEFGFAHTDYDAINKEFGSPLVPADCSKARGTLGSDYSEAETLCWYKLADFRRLYPEYKDLTDKVLSEMLYDKVGRPLKHFHPWESVGKAAGVALGLPLIVLLIGWSLLWAFSGFRSA